MCHALLPHRRCTALGSGSGIGYVIDVLQWRSAHSPKIGLNILFSTRSLDLFRWVKKTVKPFTVNNNMIQVQLALTDKHHCDVEEGLSSNISVQYHHFEFEQEIEENSTVFVQGSKAINVQIGKICHSKKAKFYGGLQAPERIEMFDALIESMHQSIHSLRGSFNQAMADLQLTS